MEKKKFAIGTYHENSGECVVHIIEAEKDTDAVQIVMGSEIEQDVTMQGLKNYYWESRMVVISDPVEI